MSRPLTEIELRWIVPRIRSTRRGLRIGWAVARWVFRIGSLLFLALGVFELLGDASWEKLLGLGALSAFIGLASLVLPSGNDGQRDPQEGDSPEARWIRGTHEIVVVGSGKSSRAIHVIGGVPIFTPSGWLDDLPEDKEVEVEAVEASTPGLGGSLPPISFWLVAIRGKRSLRAELEAGRNDESASFAGMWWLLGGIVLVPSLAIFLAQGLPMRELSELPAAWSPVPPIPASEGRILPNIDPRPGDALALGAHFAMDGHVGPQGAVAILPWRPAQRDSFLQVARGIRERMEQASRAADSARAVLWAFRPAFHDADLLDYPGMDPHEARAFRRQWRERKVERKRWLASLDTLLPGDSIWTGYLREIRREFDAVDSSDADYEQARSSASALHRSTLRLLHPDSSDLLIHSENAILRDAWTRSAQWILGVPLAAGETWNAIALTSGTVLEVDSATPPQYPIPTSFRLDERWLLHPETQDWTTLDSLPLAFRPAGAPAVWSRIDGPWVVVRLGEPSSLHGLLRSLQFWILLLAALPVWLIGGLWASRNWRRASLQAKAASTTWWAQNPEG